MDLMAVLFVGLLVVGPASVDTNTPPLADAGLDQRVVVGETVLLDGGRSRDPDGRVAAVEWHIEAPNGTTRTPACADCLRTWFAPGRIGVYEVTLAVTDEARARRTDHLRVVVEENARPRVTVEGPSRVQSGEEATYTANVTSANRLQSVVWTADGREFAQTALSGHRATTAASVVFETARVDTVRATVSDVDGDVGVDSVETAAVRAASDRSGGSAGDGNWDTGSASGGPTASSPPPATPEPELPAELDISQSARRGEYVDPVDDPEPAREPESSGGPVETLLAAARLAADAMLA